MRVLPALIYCKWDTNILALKEKKTEIVQLLLSVPSLELNIEELKKANLYMAAVEECRKYVTKLQEKDNKKMTDFDSPIVFAIKHTWKWCKKPRNCSLCISIHHLSLFDIV